MNSNAPSGPCRGRSFATALSRQESRRCYVMGFIFPVCCAKGTATGPGLLLGFRRGPAIAPAASIASASKSLAANSIAQTDRIPPYRRVILDESIERRGTHDADPQKLVVAIRSALGAAVGHRRIVLRYGVGSRLGQRPARASEPPHGGAADPRSATCHAGAARAHRGRARNRARRVRQGCGGVRAFD